MKTGTLLQVKIMNKLIKRIKSIKPKTKKLIVILVILILFGTTVSRCCFGNMNSYIEGLNVVYTPTKTAYRFHHWHWTDIYEYLVFRLSNKEEKIILQEVENGNWSKMTSEHVDKLDSLEYYDVLGYFYRYHKCYICIYDDQNNAIITNSDKTIYLETTKWIIFLYDTETNKYYYIYQSL